MISCLNCGFARVRENPAGPQFQAIGICEIRGFNRSIRWFETKWARNVAWDCEDYTEELSEPGYDKNC